MYDWDERREKHIAAHRVRPHEVGQVLANDPIRIETRPDTRSGEDHPLELVNTDASRILFVACTARKIMRPVAAV